MERIFVFPNPSNRRWRLLLAFVVGLCYLENGETIPGAVIRIDAHGRTARLGELYNIARDDFTQVSIMSQEIPPENELRLGTPKTETKYGISRTMSEQRWYMGIGIKAAVNVGVKSGSFSASASVSVSGSFLTSGLKTANRVTVVLTYLTETEQEILEIFFDNMRDRISLPILQNSKDSHVVVGIGWGANVAVSFEDSNVTSDTVLKAEGTVEAKAQVGIGGSGEGGEGGGVGAAAGINAAFNASLEFRNAMKELRMSIFGDVYMNGIDYPTNAPEVVTMIKQIPKLVNQSNEGRGKQMFFYLMPIERIREFVQKNAAPFSCDCARTLNTQKKREVTDSTESESPLDAETSTLSSTPKGVDDSSTSPSPTPETTTLDPITEIENATSNSSSPDLPDGVAELLTQTLEHADLVGRKMTDLFNLLTLFEECINTTIIRRARKVHVQLHNKTEDFRQKVIRGMVRAKTPESEKESLSRLADLDGEMEGGVEEYFQKVVRDLVDGDPEDKDDLGLYNFEDIIENEFKKAKLKIRLVELLQDLNVTWVGRGSHYWTVILNNEKTTFDTPVCIMHFYPWYLDTALHFAHKAKAAKHDDTQVYVIDCDFDHYSCSLMTSKSEKCVYVYPTVVPAQPRCTTNMVFLNASFIELTDKTAFQAKNKSVATDCQKATTPKCSCRLNGIVLNETNGNHTFPVYPNGCPCTTSCKERSPFEPGRTDCTTSLTLTGHNETNIKAVPPKLQFKTYNVTCSCTQERYIPDVECTCYDTNKPGTKFNT